jgi:hypothetical protein
MSDALVSSEAAVSDGFWLQPAISSANDTGAIINLNFGISTLLSGFSANDPESTSFHHGSAIAIGASLVGRNP